MSIHPQSHPQAIAFDDEVLDVRPHPNQFSGSNSSPASTPTTDAARLHQSGISEHFILGGHPPTSCPCQYKVYPTSPGTVLSLPIPINQQMQHSLAPWGPTHTQTISELWLSPSSPVGRMRGDSGENMASASHVPVTFDPLARNTLWQNSLDGDVMAPFVEQEMRDLGYYPMDEQSTYQPLPYPSPLFLHGMYPQNSSAQNDRYIRATESFIPYHVASHPSFSPPLSHRRPPPISPAHLEPGPSFHYAPLQNSTASSRVRRNARAIEYDGLWIDEEELLRGRMELDGRLKVYPCYWEEKRSPCHLWIKSDRSSIRAHLQKWHEGKSEGDERKAGCRWALCKKRMLWQSVARHISTCHLGETWKCKGCGKEVSRDDAYQLHAVRSKYTPCHTAGTQVTYSADVRVIDARTALDGGGRVRYAHP